MEGQLEDLLNEYKIKVFYDDQLDSNAKYVPAYNMIIVNSRMSEFDIKMAILHELAHAMYHKDFYELYRKFEKLKSKMEYEANIFMIDYMIDENENKYNYSMIFECFGFNMGMEKNFQR